MRMKLGARAAMMTMAGMASLVAACGGAPQDETTGAGDEALMSAPKYSFCSRLDGNYQAPLGAVTMKTWVPSTYTPYGPTDPVGQFQAVVTQTLGYAPFTFYANDRTTQWLAVDMSNMQEWQKTRLAELVTDPPWSRSGIVQPGIYTCTFDWGDWDEYWQDHPVYQNGHPYIPSPAPLPPTEILAYDPCPSTGKCLVFSPILGFP